MTRSFVYLDTETTGLDPHRHQVWEIAYAIDNGPILSGVVPHSLVSADPKALEVGGYWQRHDEQCHPEFEEDLVHALRGSVMVGANPAFDAGFLTQRWDISPWFYRLFDIEVFALGVIWPHYRQEPMGLRAIAEFMNEERDLNIPLPDHTAAGDVACLRVVHQGLEGWR